MSEKNGNSNIDSRGRLPVEPNYDLLEETVNSGAGTRASAAHAYPEINYNITRPRRNRGVFALCLTACLLLVFVVSAAGLILSKSAVITTENGRLALSLTKGSNGGNPFLSNLETAATEATDSVISIKDPPIITEPVESEGVLSVTQIAEKVSPCVVSILVENSYSSGLASGTILDKSGYIVTNYHVVADMTSIIVVLSTGARYDAAVVGLDERSDLAVIKINAQGLQNAVFGNSNAISVGDTAIAIGTPYNLSLKGTTTCGIISAIRRDLVIGSRTMSLIQTDASINFGNSGGPLINVFGQVIGIVSAKIGEDYEGLGFAIPMNTAKEIIEDLVLFGHVPGRAALGIEGQFLNEEYAKAYNLPVGVFITHIYNTGDTGDKLKPGDVIIAIDGVTLTDLQAYNNIIYSHKVGDIINVTVYRDTNIYDKHPGSTFSARVTLLDESELG